jgi:hypothetical protein
LSPNTLFQQISIQNLNSFRRYRAEWKYMGAGHCSENISIPQLMLAGMLNNHDSLKSASSRMLLWYGAKLNFAWSRPKRKLELWNLHDSKFDVHHNHAHASGKERALGGDFGCICCQNVQSDQPVWNTGALYCPVQPSARLQVKRRHIHTSSACMHWHHDVHKQCIGLWCIMHCRVGKKHWARKPWFPDILASCLHHVTSGHWPGRHGRAKPSLYLCHCDHGCMHGSLHAHAATIQVPFSHASLILYYFIKYLKLRKFLSFRPRSEYDQHYQQTWSQSIGPIDHGQNRHPIAILVEIQR